MMARWLFSSILVLTFASLALRAQDAPKAPSALAVGSVLPGPFESYNLTGLAKGRPHCLVCRFQQRPVVMAFTKEPTEGKDAGFLAVVKAMEDATDELQDQDLAAFVIVQSSDLRLFPSATEGKKEEAAGGVGDAKVTDEFLARLQKHTDKFKNAVLAAYPATNPPGYVLDKNAETTLVFYNRLKVVELQAFPENKLTEAEVKGFFEKVKSNLTAKEKK